MEKEKNTFTSGKLMPPLIRFTVPILLALVLQAMYGAVDLLIVGRFGDAASISAVSTGSTLMQTVTVIIAGFTMGATVLIGRCIGAGEKDEAGRAVGAAVCVFSIMAVLLTAVLLIFAEPLARLLNAPEDALSQTVLYLNICGGGTVFIVAYNVISGIFRGIGNSRLPLVFVAIACAVNIAGDLILTGWLGMDVTGVAISTVTAQTVSVVLSLLIIRRQKLPFHFRRAYLRFPRAQMKAILRLGWPIALQDALTNISFLVVTSLVNNMGLMHSAGYGVAQKVIQFIMLVPSAFMQAVSAIVAQNIGAGKLKRAKKVMFYAMGTAFCVGIFMFLAGFFGGGTLARIFSNDAQVIAQAADYIRGFSLDCILTGFLFSFVGYFNGSGKTGFVMAQGLCGAFLVRIPLSYLFSRTEGASLVYMGLATPAATIFSIVLCVGYYLTLERRTKRQNRLESHAA